MAVKVDGAKVRLFGSKIDPIKTGRTKDQMKTKTKKAPWGGTRAGAGRKVTTGPTAPPPVSFRLNKDDDGKLAMRAKAAGVSSHTLAKSVVVDYLNPPQSAVD